MQKSIGPPPDPSARAGALDVLTFLRMLERRTTAALARGDGLAPVAHPAPVSGCSTRRVRGPRPPSPSPSSAGARVPGQAMLSHSTECWNVAALALACGAPVAHSAVGIGGRAGEPGPPPDPSARAGPLRRSHILQNVGTSRRWPSPAERRWPTARWPSAAEQASQSRPHARRPAPDRSTFSHSQECWNVAAPRRWHRVMGWRGCCVPRANGGLANSPRCSPGKKCGTLRPAEGESRASASDSARGS